MLAYTTAYRDAPSSSGVDLSKRTAPYLYSVDRPAVGDIVYVADVSQCGASVTGESGYGGYVCNRAAGHGTTPHVACAATYDASYRSVPGYYVADVLAVTPPEVTDPTDLAALVESLRSQVATARREVTSQRDRADTAEQKISDIRDYVIERKDDREICAAGTLRFLRHFDLPGWEQTYTVHYGDLTFEVEAMSFAQAAGRASRAMRAALESGGFPFVTNSDYSPNSIDDDDGESDYYPYDGDGADD